MGQCFLCQGRGVTWAARLLAWSVATVEWRDLNPGCAERKGICEWIACTMADQWFLLKRSNETVLFPRHGPRYLSTPRHPGIQGVVGDVHEDFPNDKNAPQRDTKNLLTKKAKTHWQCFLIIHNVVSLGVWGVAPLHLTSHGPRHHPPTHPNHCHFPTTHVHTCVSFSLPLCGTGPISLSPYFPSSFSWLPSRAARVAPLRQQRSCVCAFHLFGRLPLNEFLNHTRNHS